MQPIWVFLYVSLANGSKLVAKIPWRQGVSRKLVWASSHGSDKTVADFCHTLYFSWKVELNSKFLYSFLLSKQTNPERARRIKRLKVGQKILYILVVLILVLTLIWQVYSCMVNYAAEPTYTETKVVKQQKAKFPAFTFCVEGSSYKVDVLQVKLCIFCIMYYL